MGDGRRDDVATQIHSRDINEWIEAMVDRVGEGRLLDTYRCECSDARCRCGISLSRLEYEDVRSDGTHFAVAVHHEDPHLDHVLFEGERFAIVGLLPGRPSSRARAGDPRRSPAA